MWQLGRSWWVAQLVSGSNSLFLVAAWTSWCHHQGLSSPCVFSKGHFYFAELTRSPSSRGLPSHSYCPSSFFFLTLKGRLPLGHWSRAHPVRVDINVECGFWSCGSAITWLCDLGISTRVAGLTTRPLWGHGEGIHKWLSTPVPSTLPFRSQRRWLLLVQAELKKLSVRYPPFPPCCLLCWNFWKTLESS